MNPHLTSQGSEFATSFDPLRTVDERCLLVALTGSGQHDTLVRYAAFWDTLHHQSSLPADPPCPLTPLLGSTLPLGTTALGRKLFVSAPRNVQFLHVPRASRHSSAELLRQTRQMPIDSLAVDEPRLARDLIRRAPCSVWFVPERAQPVLRRVLVAVDFSVRGADSLRVALTLARLSGAAECIALHVYENDAILTGAVGTRAVRHEVWMGFDRFMKPIDTLGVKVRPCFREATDVPRTIRATALEQQADLIILGSRGRTWAASLLRPAIAELVLPDCPVPLLVVKHFGATRSFASVLRERLRSRANDLRCN